MQIHLILKCKTLHAMHISLHCLKNFPDIITTVVSPLNLYRAILICIIHYWSSVSSKLYLKAQRSEDVQNMDYPVYKTE